MQTARSAWAELWRGIPRRMHLPAEICVMSTETQKCRDVEIAVAECGKTGGKVDKPLEHMGEKGVEKGVENVNNYL